jgi:hypothetical protein
MATRQFTATAGAMLYFFNLYNDVITQDHEGTDLADDEAAIALAMKEARAMAAESVTRGHLTRHHRVEVANEAGEIVRNVRFDEAVEIRD